MNWALMPPDQLIWIEPVRVQASTAENFATGAVIAGRPPVHFPVRRRYPLGASSTSALDPVRSPIFRSPGSPRRAR
jgi:hypothetical protein